MLLWKEKVVELEPYPVWVRTINQNLEESRVLQVPNFTKDPTWRRLSSLTKPIFQTTST